MSRTPAITSAMSRKRASSVSESDTEARPRLNRPISSIEDLPVEVLRLIGAASRPLQAKISLSSTSRTIRAALVADLFKVVRTGSRWNGRWNGAEGVNDVHSFMRLPDTSAVLSNVKTLITGCAGDRIDIKPDPNCFEKLASVLERISRHAILHYELHLVQPNPSAEVSVPFQHVCQAIRRLLPQLIILKLYANLNRMWPSGSQEDYPILYSSVLGQLSQPLLQLRRLDMPFQWTKYLLPAAGINHYPHGCTLPNLTSLTLDLVLRTAHSVNLPEDIMHAEQFLIIHGPNITALSLQRMTRTGHNILMRCAPSFSKLLRLQVEVYVGLFNPNLREEEVEKDLIGTRVGGIPSLQTLEVIAVDATDNLSFAMWHVEDATIVDNMLGLGSNSKQIHLDAGEFWDDINIATVNGVLRQTAQRLELAADQTIKVTMCLILGYMKHIDWSISCITGHTKEVLDQMLSRDRNRVKPPSKDSYYFVFDNDSLEQPSYVAYTGRPEQVAEATRCIYGTLPSLEYGAISLGWEWRRSLA